MGKFFGSWSFYKRTLLIAVPVMIQNLITNFVALIDNIMVGQVGTAEMSGVAIVNQILFVFNLAVFGVISGAGIFCAQFFGKEDNDGVRHTFRYKLISATIVVAISIGIFLFFGDELIRSFLHDADKGIDLEVTFFSAKQYLAIMLLGLFPFAIEQAYSGTLREGGVANPPMVAGVVAVIANTILNALLIFGIGPFPQLGVAGAAIATVISRYIQVGLVILWTHLSKDRLGYVRGLYRSLKIPKQLAGRIFIKGLPLLLNEFLWGLGMAVLSQCYSIRGIDVVASFNIANTVVNLFNVAFIAFGSGVSVVLGQLLGANDLKGAKDGANKLIAFSGIMCIAIAALMAVLARVFPLAYNTTGDVRNLAAWLIVVSAVFMPVHGTLHCAYFTLRSGGKTFITFLFDSCFTWGVSVPVAYCLVHFTSLNILTVYAIVQAIELIKLIVGMVLVNKGMWISNIVSD